MNKGKQKKITAKLLKKTVVRPIVRCVEAQARLMSKLLEKSLNKLQGIEDLINLVAGEADQEPEADG